MLKCHPRDKTSTLRRFFAHKLVSHQFPEYKEKDYKKDLQTFELNITLTLTPSFAFHFLNVVSSEFKTTYVVCMLRLLDIYSMLAKGLLKQKGVEILN